MQEKHSPRRIALPPQRKRESGNAHKRLNKKGRKEEGKGFDIIRTLYRAEQHWESHSPISGSPLVRRANPQEQAARSEAPTGHTGEAVPPLGRHPVEAVRPPTGKGPSRPRRTATFAGIGTKMR